MSVCFWYKGAAFGWTRCAEISAENRWTECCNKEAGRQKYSLSGWKKWTGKLISNNTDGDWEGIFMVNELILESHCYK